MRTWGRTALAEFLGDFLVYRNLAPTDARLPNLDELAPGLDLPRGTIPRKSQPAYARVIVELLRRARSLDLPGTELRSLIVLGDTRLNDGTAFANICRCGGLNGLAFIGAETGAPARLEMAELDGQPICLANRWTALVEFDRLCRQRGVVPDEHAAVVVDLDKTALGARGRNDRLIDRARLQAMRSTIDAALGSGFDPEALETAYRTLNQPEFHPFTADNQDYLAYVCLVISSGAQDLASLVAEVSGGTLQGFGAFIGRVEERRGQLPAGLRDAHGEVFASVRAGDPTPFKEFRRNEYRTTVGLMGCLGDDTSAAEQLAGEIVITEEVRRQVLAWRADGALVLGLSDKPDEASIPAPDLVAAGHPPIHRAEAHSVGA